MFRKTSRETNGAAVVIESPAPGRRLTVPAGTPHKFWNAGDDVAHFVCEVRPALQFESLLETMFALAEDGKTNRRGMPNPLRLAVIANGHLDTVRLPFPPALVQRIALALGAPGRAARRLSPQLPAHRRMSMRLRLLLAFLVLAGLVLAGAGPVLQRNRAYE